MIKATAVAQVFKVIAIFVRRLISAGKYGLHIHPKIFSFLLPPLPRIFLILAASALVLSGFTACAPLKNFDSSIAVQKITTQPPETEAALPQESSSLPEEWPTSEVITPQTLKLAVSPEIHELAQPNTWDALPLLSTGEEIEAYDFPITINGQVEYYLDFFTNRHRKTFARWLARSARYLPMIKEEFAKAGLPLDLAYLPMIESGFNTSAISKASAVGTWQFMRATGKYYGLTVNDYVDERRDPVKSTKAAAAYLAKLYKDFDSWHLAVAAYNAGEGKIKKALKQSDSEDFWELAQSQYIHSETKLYVPQLIAAIMIAKDPEKYGFTGIDYDEQLDYETVHVPRGTPLKAVALACHLPEEKILSLNRHLSRAITPPSETDYPLRVPPGNKDIILKNLPRVRQVTITEFKTHEVKRGETLTTIRRHYNLSKTTLLKANNLEQERLSLGQHLRIPFQTTAYKLIDEPLHLDRARNNIALLSIRTEVPATPAETKKNPRSLKKKTPAKAGKKVLLSATGMKKKPATTDKKEKPKKSPKPLPKKSGSGQKK